MVGSYGPWNTSGFNAADVRLLDDKSKLRNPVKLKKASGSIDAIRLFLKLSDLMLSFGNIGTCLMALLSNLNHKKRKIQNHREFISVHSR